MAALLSNGTYEHVPLHSEMTIIDCRGVYIMKVGPNDHIDHFKARLMAKGYTHIYIQLARISEIDKNKVHHI
jgi:hypothetical protein